jgi:hypothetical protein
MTLNPDQLGAKGESRFAEWCDDVGLIANKSHRDKAGWDFVVDFPLPETKRTFDHRPAALVCLVQVKTILAKSRSVKLRLDMAERLAKDVRPSFVVVPVVNDALEFTAVHVLHIAGEYLERILERLRKSSLGGSVLSKQTITFGISDTSVLSPNGTSLKSAFQAACPDGMNAYAHGKEKACNTAGFDVGAYRVQMTFSPSEADALLDGFLGLRKDLRVERLQMTETRFDIPVDDDPLGDGAVSFEPVPAGEGRMRLFSDAFVHPLSQSVDFFAVPFPIAGKRRMLFSGPVVRFIASHDMSVRHVHSKIEVVDAREAMPLSAWRERAAWGLAMTRGDFVLEVEVPDRPLLRIPQAALTDNANEVDAVAVTVTIMDVLQELATRAGEDPALLLSQSDINRAFRLVQTVAGLHAGDAHSLEPDGATAPAFTPFRVLLGSVMCLGERNLAWSGTATLGPPVGDDPNLPLSGFVLGAVRAVRDVGEFENFFKDAAHKQGGLQAIVFGEVPLGFFPPDQAVSSNPPDEPGLPASSPPEVG